MGSHCGSRWNRSDCPLRRLWLHCESVSGLGVNFATNRRGALTRFLSPSTSLRSFVE